MEGSHFSNYARLDLKHSESDAYFMNKR